MNKVVVWFTDLNTPVVYASADVEYRANWVHIQYGTEEGTDETASYPIARISKIEESLSDNFDGLDD